MKEKEDDFDFQNFLVSSYFEEQSEHKFFGIITSKAQKMCADKIKHKIYELITTMNSDFINLSNLKKYVFEGIPDEIQSLRSLTWKLLFNYLPSNCSIWEDFLDSKRLEYFQIMEKYVINEEVESKHISSNTSNTSNRSNTIKNSNKNSSSELSKVIYDKVDTEILDADNHIIVDKTANTSTSNKNQDHTNVNENLHIENLHITGLGENKSKKIKKSVTSDHPLSNTDNSIWKNRFLDKELTAEIDKDVRRTRSHMHFFFMPTNNEFFKSENIGNYVDYVEKKRNEVKSQKNNSKTKYEAHADVLTRILFIYAKLNPEVRYIQGMNEVLAPIYYCFSLDQNPYFSKYREADAYFCFSNLMSVIKDVFIRVNDNRPNGINSRITNIFSILVTLDKDLSQKFLDQKIEIHYFAFRWVTLLLTQEFEMPDVLRLWDSVLSHENLYEIISFLCVSIFNLKRKELINADFSGIMESMQSLEKIDVEILVKTAEKLNNEYNIKMKEKKANNKK